MGLSVQDRLEIQDLLYTYAWSLDTGDVDSFVNCFAEEGALVWESFDLPLIWQGHAKLAAFAAYLASVPATAGRQHHVSNILAEGNAQEASVKAYVTVVLRQEHGQHPITHPITVVGWYDDLMIATPSGWKIKTHKICDWSGPVLAKLAGQSGGRTTRPLPAALEALASTIKG